MLLTRKKPLVIFFALAYAIAWICWLPLVLSRTGLGLLPITVPIPYVIVGTYAPLIAALLTQQLFNHDLKAFRLSTSWKRLVAGLIIGPLLIAFTFVFLTSLLMTRGSFAAWHWQAFNSYPLQIAYRHSILMAGPIGEEPGWRGYALPKLQASLGPTLASLVLGCLWFGWHLPLFLIPAWTSASMLTFALIVIGLSFLMTFGFNISGSSVIVAVIMHATFNASPKVLGDFLNSAEVRENPSPELMISLAFIGAAILVGAFTRGRLAMSKGAT